MSELILLVPLYDRPIRNIDPPNDRWPLCIHDSYVKDLLETGRGCHLEFSGNDGVTGDIYKSVSSFQVADLTLCILDELDANHMKLLTGHMGQTTNYCHEKCARALIKSLMT